MSDWLSKSTSEQSSMSQNRNKNHYPPKTGTVSKTVKLVLPSHMHSKRPLSLILKIASKEHSNGSNPTASRQPALSSPAASRPIKKSEIAYFKLDLTILSMSSSPSLPGARTTASWSPGLALKGSIKHWGSKNRCQKTPKRM